MARLAHIAVTASLVQLLVLTPRVAAADGPYELKRSQEQVWLGAGLAVWLGGFIATRQVEPLSSAQITALSLDDINTFDRDRMRPYREDHAGDAMAAGSYLFPLAFFANDDTRRDFDTLGTMWVEATMWNLGLAGIAKAVFQRTRPYVYDPDAPADLKSSRSARLSFYSAHSASAALNSFFLARVFSDYTDNRNSEIALWSGAVIYPALAAFFRTDTGHHFVTDAITGCVVGATIGYLVPVLHRRDDSDLSVSPTTNNGAPGFGFSLSFNF
jgi:membrane-associated phospholipid phosphatase